MTLYIDTHEPLEALTNIQVVVPALVKPLNDQGYADYMWEAHGEQVQFERKQWGELTNGLDKVEYQLRQEKAAHPEARLGLIVEGVATPSIIGTQLWSQSKNKDVYYKTRDQNCRYSMVAAWLYQVGKHMEVVRTADFRSTCMELVAMYQSDQKESHTTFARYLKPIDWHPNQQVEMLMALGNGVGIGASKAEALIKRYGTVWNILCLSPKELAMTDGIGKILSTKLLRKIGRPDV